MIHFKSGDILSEDVDALVNSVNCVGIMGRGIALGFKHAFAANYKAYAAACERGEVQPGRMFVYETGQLTNPRFIINFPTKRHWRGGSRIEDIDAGLSALASEIRNRDIHSIAISPLGCGLGGLDWTVVRPRIEAALQPFLDLRVVLFEPGGVPADNRGNRSITVPPMTVGRAAVVGLIDRYLQGLLDPFVSLLEVHKLMYFMQAAGEPLQLRYKEAAYGPYAENLRHALAKVEGHLLTGYADGGDAPDKQLQLVPGAIEDATAFLKDRPATQAHFEQVCDLVEGYESPFGLELLSTVHWVVAKDPRQSFGGVVERTYAWNERKKQFSERQIRLAVDVLAAKGWIEPLRS